MDYITSDLHFWHGNILKFNPKTRPFKDVEHMNEMLLQECESLLTENDTLYILGDFSFKGAEATTVILERLKAIGCEIILIVGNHDKKLLSLYKQYFKCYDYLEISFNKKKICMMHFPIACWNRAAHGSIMLHGHTHGSYQGVGRTIDVGYDNLGKIVTLESIVNKLSQKQIEVLDHHG